jgi:prolyl oligopeptidase
VLIDPNTLSPDGSVSVHGIFPSRDGRLVAYKLSRNNADASILQIRDLEAGRDLPDLIDNARYASPSWTPDGRGFYYVWLPPDPTIPPAELPGRAEVRYHRVGEPGPGDAVIAPATGDASRFVGVHLSRDGAWLFSPTSTAGTAPTCILKDMSAGTGPKDHADGPTLPPGFRPLIAGQPAIYDVIAWRGAFYVHTDDGAPRYRIFKVDPSRPARADWREIVAQQAATLEGAQIVGDRLVLSYLRDAHSELAIHDLGGAPLGRIALPGLGTTSGLIGEPDDPRAYYPLHLVHPARPDLRGRPPPQ